MSDKVISGVDLGGTFIKFGLFTEQGECLEKWQVPTGSRSREYVFSTIAKEVLHHSSQAGYDRDAVAGVGMGVPASVDDQGMMIHAPNLGWSMVDVRQEMKPYLDVPLFVANDANVAALGEQFYGIGSGCDSLVLVTLGTGVGGGVIVHGRIVAGHFGGAGEIGHMAVNPAEKVPCTCGNYGCLEQYASATGIARMAKQMLADTDSKSVLRSQDTITAKEVFDAVKAGDALAVEVAEQFGDILGRSLALVASVMDPEMFVIGGGVSAAGDILLEYIQKYYRQYAFTTSKDTPFRLASLGNDAGICGAARLVMLNGI